MLLLSVLQTLAINGCPGATRELWEGVHAPGAPPLALRSLSAVGCKKLRACWLGMAPATQGDLDRQEHLLQVGMYSPPASCDTAWREVPVSLSGALRMPPPCLHCDVHQWICIP